MEWAEIFFKGSVDELVEAGGVFGDVVAAYKINKATLLATTAAEIIARYVLSGGVEANISGDIDNTIKLMVLGYILLGKGFAETDGVLVYPLPPYVRETERGYAIGDRPIKKDNVVKIEQYGSNGKPQGLIDVLEDNLFEAEGGLYASIVGYFTEFEYPSLIGVIEGVSEQELEKIKYIWAKRYADKSNSIFLLNTPMQVEKLERQLDAKTLEYVDNTLIARVAALSGVPANLLRGEKPDPAAESVFVRTVIQPIRRKIEKAFRQKDITVKFNGIMVAPGLLAELSDAVAKGVISINEAREVIGLQPVDGGDELYILNPQGVERPNGEKE